MRHRGERRSARRRGWRRRWLARREGRPPCVARAAATRLREAAESALARAELVARLGDAAARGVYRPDPRAVAAALLDGARDQLLQ